MHEPKLDARSQRTRDALGDALVALMHEKAFDQITVQNVLDRAGVSRATFYSHYSDKDDLFLSDVEVFFQHLAGQLSARKEQSRRVAPVRELFAHVADAKQFVAALVASGKIHDVMELGQGLFARGIEQRLAELDPQQDAVARKVRSQVLAGGMLSLMQWWIGRGAPEPAETMDEQFHRTVWG